METQENKFFEKKSDLFNEVNEDVQTNSSFLVTAKTIRTAIKSAIESLWHKTYNVTPADVQKYQWYEANHWSDTSDDAYCIHVPKCDTIYMSKEVVDLLQNQKLHSIYMDGVENGHVVSFMAQCVIPLFPIVNATAVYKGYILAPDDTTSEWTFIENTETKMRYYKNGEPIKAWSNIVLQYDKFGVYNYVNNQSSVFDLRRMFAPLHLMYWNGLWFPVNLY